MRKRPAAKPVGLRLLTVALTTALGLATCGGPARRSDQSLGETAFRQNCQTCHVLPKPGLKTDQEWPELVARYGERARLSAETQQEILDYLLSVN